MRHSPQRQPEDTNETAKRKWKLCYGIRPVGKTTDGRQVVSGFDCFKMSETIGIPLDMLIHSMYTNDQVIDWIEFVETAKSVGWKTPTIMMKVENALEDCEIDPSPIMERIKQYIVSHWTT